MKNTLLMVVASSLMLSVLNTHAVLYNGNGNTGAGGVIGNSTLNITDNGNIITFDLSSPIPINFNALGNGGIVFYLDTVPGGYTSTAPLNDQNTSDMLRQAITNIGASQTIFPTGFTADKAIAFRPFGVGNGFAGLWDIAANPTNFQYLTSANLSPETNNSTTYTWSLPISSLGIAPGDSFSFVGLIVTQGFGNGYIYNEGYGGGLPNNNPGEGGSVTFTSALTYTTVPEPSTYALIITGLLLFLWYGRHAGVGRG